MALQINADTIFSDLVPDLAHKEGNSWHATNYLGRTFDGNQAITAMTIAEIEGQNLGSSNAALLADLRAELS